MAFQSPGRERWGSPVTQLTVVVPAGWWHDKFPDSCHHPWTTFSHPQPSGGDTTTATEQYIHLSINNEKSIQEILINRITPPPPPPSPLDGGPGNVLLHPIGRGLLPPLTYLSHLDGIPLNVYSGLLKQSFSPCPCPCIINGFRIKVQ